VNLPAPESAGLPYAELARILNMAARVLKTEGRRAASAGVFGVGTRMLMTADALHRAADVLLATTQVEGARDRQAFADACENVGALGAFLWWERDRLCSYRAALERYATLNDGAIETLGENNERGER